MKFLHRTLNILLHEIAVSDSSAPVACKKSIQVLFGVSRVPDANSDHATPIRRVRQSSSQGSPY
jgi:hypothetical protein